MKVAIIGCGLIGLSWAAMFGKKGYTIALYDSDPTALAKAQSQLGDILHKLAEDQLLDKDITVEWILQNVSTHSDLAEAVQGAEYIQECVFEDTEIKQKVFLQLDKVAHQDAILASSTSYILPSVLSRDMVRLRGNTLIAHSINPSLFVELVEVVPAPWTRPEIVEKTRNFLVDIGKKPVILKKEVLGFASNRMQSAILNAALNIFEEGLLTVEEIDTVAASLNARYSFVGVFQTMFLNAPGGIKDYAERYYESLRRTRDEANSPNRFSLEVADRLHQEVSCLIPSEHIRDHISWRNESLKNLSISKKSLPFPSYS